MKRILIATDGSKFSEEAAWLVSRMPHPSKIHVVIATVVNPPDYAYPAYESETWTVDLAKQQQELATASANKVADFFAGANATTEHLMLQGPIGSTICKVAEDEGIDLIVIGASGHSALARIMLGSVSDYVATHAHCSVLVIRPTGLRNEARPMRVAIAYNATAQAHAALEEFAETLWGKGADVNLVSVTPSYVSFFGELPADREVEERVANALRVASTQVHVPEASLHTHAVSSSSVGEGLVKFAEDHHADLIVLGESPKGFLGRLLMGSVSRYVLRHAPCGIWIARNRATRNVPAAVRDEALALEADRAAAAAG